VPGPRFPLAPLLAMLELSQSQLSNMYGVGGQSLKRWRECGLTVEAADRLAVRAGLHPAEVWPEWWTA